jgi:glycosyltransferase involved in cell wall biosynthesis
MNKSTLRVGITAYREGKLLKRAYESICNQTDQNWEGCIVLDGNSNSETLETFCSIEDERFTKIQLETNTGGPYIPREVFFEKLPHDICLFLDADDCYTPDAFATIRKLFEDPEVMWISGAVKLIYEDQEGNFISESYISGDPITPEDLIRSSIFPGVVLFRRSLFKNFGGYDRNLIRDHADTDLMLSILEGNFRSSHTNEVLMFKYERPLSMSRSYNYRMHEVYEYIARKHIKTFSNKNLQNFYLSNAYLTASRANLEIGNSSLARALSQQALNLNHSESSLELLIIRFISVISSFIAIKLLDACRFYKTLQSKIGLRSRIKSYSKNLLSYLLSSEKLK